MASLRGDVDAIIDEQVLWTESTQVEPTKDTVLAALFKTTIAPPPPPSEQTNRHRSKEGDVSCVRKRERTNLEAARRASLMDEEARQIRAHELATRNLAPGLLMLREDFRGCCYWCGHY